MALAILPQRRHITGRQALSRAVALEPLPVITVEAVLGADPQEACRVLREALDRLIAESLLRAVGAEGVATLRERLLRVEAGVPGKERQKQQRDAEGAEGRKQETSMACRDWMGLPLP